MSEVEVEPESDHLPRFYALVIAFYVQLPPIERLASGAVSALAKEIYQLAEAAISNTIN